MSTSAVTTLFPSYNTNFLDELKYSDEYLEDSDDSGDSDSMPQSYLIPKLHEDGHENFNNETSADAQLFVEDLPAPFWIHRNYLEPQSTFFKDKFEEYISGKPMEIKVPSPENFEPLLEYLYTGDGDKWYDSMNLDNYYEVWTNVNFLGLGHEANAICMAYYQNVVLEN
ncbi:10064_t:CDS:1 [Funneliformis caledonium]|uniref:10064_t:CDS:1 n=1 Tax=Funneliformis caledonium TaxID=1117310 RepID=A0A9N9CX73_9GLOM|nr:10064_t:CDS:1 [Funneliformis caledonium]